MTATRRSTRPRAARFVPNGAPSGREERRHANASPSCDVRIGAPRIDPTAPARPPPASGTARVTADWSLACSSRSTPSLRLALLAVPVTPARFRLRCGTVRNSARSTGQTRAVEPFAGSAETTRERPPFVSLVVSARRRRARTRLAGLLARCPHRRRAGFTSSVIELPNSRIPPPGTPRCDRSTHDLGLSLRVAHTGLQVGVLSGSELALRPASSASARKPPTARTGCEAGARATGCDCGAGPLPVHYFYWRRPSARGRFARSCVIARWA